MIDFSLDTTQKELVGAARDFGREILAPAEAALDRRASGEDIFASERYWAVMKQAFELGFHKMNLPEHVGGLNLDPITTGLVWEELARWGVGFAASLVAAAVVPRMIAVFAPTNKELMDRFVRPFCEENKPTHISAWGSSEPNIGSDGKNYYDLGVHHASKATRKPGGYVLSGTKSNFVSNGGIAHSFIIFACLDPAKGLRGSGTFVMPADAPGVTRSKPLDKIGLRLLNQAPVFFDEVELPEGYMIFPPCDGYPMMHNTIVTVGNLGTGYLAVGLMRAAYEEALAYSKTRIQWGKPIFEHQLVARKLHETHTAIETARALLWKGSWLSKTSFPGDLKTSLTAKIYATNQAAHHTAEMVQVLGGYGISADYPLEKYMRDAPLLQIMDGTNDTLQMKAAALL